MIQRSTESDALWLRLVILALIAVAAFSSRLFSVIRFESIIHEFDPWFNYRSTQKLVNDGIYEFWNWFDERSWYPLGRVVGSTLYPGLMVTAGAIYRVLHFFNFPVDIRNVCVFFAPAFSTATAVSMFFLTNEIWNDRAALFAAAFIGVAPGYISRSVAGSYDNEGIAIFLLVFTFYLWIKSVKRGSAFYGALTALFYFYMVSAWGGYMLITNLIPLHVFVLLIMGRYDRKIYISYCSWYTLGTIASMQVPFVNYAAIRSSEHMASLGIFGLLQLVAFYEFLRSHLRPGQLKFVAIVGFSTLVASILLLLVFLHQQGVILPWGGRFYSLWDTGYAKKHIPIIASVSEHQPTVWTSFYFDLNALVFLFPVGMYLCFRELQNEHVFIIIYGVLSSYFAGVMVRLMLTLTPVVCVSAAIGISTLLDTYLQSDKSNVLKYFIASPPRQDSLPEDTPKSPSKPSPTESTTPEKKIESRSFPLDLKILVVVPIAVILILFSWHSTWVTSVAYSSPTVILASNGPAGERHIIDDFREAYYWLRKNTGENENIMAWWDYGYQIAGMSNRTTLVDNNTWNFTHIATVGKIFASSETGAYEMMKKLEVDYILVLFGGLVAFSGDDINKFLWMIRIAEGEFRNEVSEAKFYNAKGEFRVDDDASPTFKNSLMYKLVYYRFKDMFPPGRDAIDRARRSAIMTKNIKLNVVDEVYTSENWLVRIYKVKKPDLLGRKFKELRLFNEGKRRTTAGRDLRKK